MAVVSDTRYDTVRCVVCSYFGRCLADSGWHLLRDINHGAATVSSSCADNRSIAIVHCYRVQRHMIFSILFGEFFLYFLSNYLYKISWNYNYVFYLIMPLPSFLLDIIPQNIVVWNYWSNYNDNSQINFIVLY